MPERYEAIRDSCKAKGGSDKACKTKAAKIFNSTRGEGEAPVTGKSEALENIVSNFLESHSGWEVASNTSDPNYFYHVTPRSNTKKILKHGLRQDLARPQYKRDNFLADLNKGRNYLFQVGSQFMQPPPFGWKAHVADEQGIDANKFITMRIHKNIVNQDSLSTDKLYTNPHYGALTTFQDVKANPEAYKRNKGEALEQIVTNFITEKRGPNDTVDWDKAELKGITFRAMERIASRKSQEASDRIERIPRQSVMFKNAEGEMQKGYTYTGINQTRVHATSNASAALDKIRRNAHLMQIPFTDQIPSNILPFRKREAVEIVKKYLMEVNDTLHSYDPLLHTLSKSVGNKVYLVGGPVRDALMGRKSKDTDVVTIGKAQNLVDKGWTNIKKDFPVFTHKEHPGVELALGRAERKTGEGHSGFDWGEAPDLETDLNRRDFTVNSMAYHPEHGIIDPHGGRSDIEKKTLRHVSDAFGEDPLRTFRAGRFASQLNFDVAPETIAQVQKTHNELPKLSKERVRDEVQKALAARNPRKFFDTLRTTKSLSHWFPEIEKTIGVPAGPAKNHPEGDTYTHSMLALQHAADKGYDIPTRQLALVHDLGKAETPPTEWPKHHGHEKRVEPAINMAQRFDLGKGTERQWDTHIRHHMMPMHDMPHRPGTTVKWQKAVKNFAEPHLNAISADYHGRGIERPPFTALDTVRKEFQAVKDTKIEPGTSPDKIHQLQAQNVRASRNKEEAWDKINNLVEGARHTYFKKRLKELGMYDDDSDYDGHIGRAVEQLSNRFEKQKHSGMSAAMTVGLWKQLHDEWANPKQREKNSKSKNKPKKKKKLKESLTFIIKKYLTELKMADFTVQKVYQPKDVPKDDTLPTTVDYNPNSTLNIKPKKLATPPIERLVKNDFAGGI